MKDMKKFRKNLIFLLVVTAIYIVLAYISRGYYTPSLEVFTPLWVYICWLYADKDNNKYA